jgi:hypothetical protein
MKYRVKVTRTETRSIIIVVEAPGPEDAEHKAVDEAGDYDFRNGSVEGEPEYKGEEVG